ncbi:MAG: serine/threonine-protein kinase [Myxococcota bacterium]
MSEDSEKKEPTEAMGSLEGPAPDVPLSDDLTMRESFGTDMTAPHQAVGDLSEIGGDSTLAAVPTPVNVDLRATRQESPAGHQESVTKVGDGASSDADDRADLDAKIRRRIAESEATSKPDPLIGKEFGGRFTVTKKVGEGGMGAVYRARQKGMDRDVAVKVLLGDLARNETVVKRFHLEALAVSKLRHPNTIQIFDFGESDDGLLYIAMEFLEGKSLHQVLQEERVLSARRAIKIAQQMAKSLREAHAKGIVHRDLKPDNIFLCTVGEEMDYVKVLDFGVAKLRDGEDGKDLTKTGTIFGTPKYMSPEQASAGIVDARSDLYAIGVILYEMLTGRAPFMADNSLGILIQHIQEPVPAFEQVQPDLVYPDHVMSLVYRLLAKKAEQRPQTAEALIRECATVLETTEDIYRNVLTRAEAVEIGLEMALTPRTRHDTIISTGESQGAPTEGPFQEPTLAISEEVKPRKSIAMMAGFSALVMIGASAAIVYASIPPLPETFANFEGFTSTRIGTLPEIALEMSTVGITTQPTGVVIEGLDTPVKDSSAFNVTRPRGSEPVVLTFKKEGYKSYTYTFRFDEAVPPPVGITLTRAEDPRPPVVKVARPKRPKNSGNAGRKAAGTAGQGSSSTTTAPAKAEKAAPAKPAVKKVTKLPAKPSKLSKLKSSKKLKPTLKLKSKGPSKLK